MQYIPFAKSETKISRLGFGCWGIGKKIWKGGDDALSKRALHTAVENGITFFDSARVYGNGHSERLVGEVERESKIELFITSKIPSQKMEWPARDSSTLHDSFPTGHIITQTEESLRALKRDHIDLMQFHVWNDSWRDDEEWQEAAWRLKKSGKVRFWGLSLNDHQPQNGIKTAQLEVIDSVQVIFNIFDQSPADSLLPLCKENDIAVVARVPFDEGALTGNIRPDTDFPKKDWRNSYFEGDRKEQVWERLQAIMDEVEDVCASPAEAALRFVLSFNAVTTVIPGMRRPEHVLDNLRHASKGALPENTVAKLGRHRWQRNFYGSH